jgi:hypothetical protein
MGVVQQQRIEMVFTPAEAKPEMIGSSNHIASMVGTEFTCRAQSSHPFNGDDVNVVQGSVVTSTLKCWQPVAVDFVDWVSKAVF